MLENVSLLFNETNQDAWEGDNSMSRYLARNILLVEMCVAESALRLGQQRQIASECNVLLALKKFESSNTMDLSLINWVVPLYSSNPAICEIGVKSLMSVNGEAVECAELLASILESHDLCCAAVINMLSQDQTLIAHALAGLQRPLGERRHFKIARFTYHMWVTSSY